MVAGVLWLAVLVAGVSLIVWGAETFAEHLGRAAVRLGVGAFALALLLAGAEPEELATVVVASLRDAPGIGFGDIIGANIAMCLVALGIGAAVAPLPFSRRVFVYALTGLPIGALAIVLMWDGRLSRPEGVLLVGLYVAYVAAIWLFERAPPALGETEELAEAKTELASAPPTGLRRRVGVELGLVLAGLLAMAVGASVLVEAVRQLTGVERTQTLLGLTVVGFATAFETVVLCFSAARRGATDVALAGVVGSFAYNMTMSLGAGALARPLAIVDAASLHRPLLVMMGCLIVVLLLAAPRRQLGRAAGVALLAAYPVFLLAAWLWFR
jgi:cation:H+ antiporter